MDERDMIRQEAFDSAPLNEVKVVFLGDGGAGKSHTIARLLNDGRQTSNFRGISAPGIAIADKDYTIGDRKVKVHFWDFGGQEILHSMHRMFLTKRTLYVVMLNVRDGNQDERARYWLHNLKSFADGAPVLLVLNQMDLNPNASINEEDLRKLYLGLAEVVRLSTLIYSDERFKSDFIDVLLDQIGNMDILAPSLTAAGRRVKVKLQNMTESYISGDDFQRFCDECGVADSVAVRRDLLEQFGQLGVSFCYSGSMELEDHVVLRPDWITNAIYIILFNKVEAVRNGLVDHETIYKMLSSEDTETVRRTVAAAEYTRDEVDYVLKVFRKFRLSFLVEDGMEFLPMLCDANSTAAASEYENDPNALEFQMLYEYLPNNVIHRLMVDRRKELDRSNVWLTGARFVSERMGLSAVVRSEGNVLRIFIRQERTEQKPQVYLSALRTDLERINGEMGLSGVRDQVAYKQGGMVECFEYDGLRDMFRLGVERVYSRAFRSMIPVRDILKQTDLQIVEKKQKLLADLAAACEQIQNSRPMWNATEDDRNDALRNHLWSGGYAVAHPSLVDMGIATAQRAEVDILLMDEDRQPWTVIEALNVRGSGRSSFAHWDIQLSKLLNRYNSQGMQMLFLISYVNCSRDKYQMLRHAYSEHMRWYDPAHCSRLSGTYRQTELPEIASPFVQIEQCSYDCGGVTATVYHYFLWAGEDVSAGTSPKWVPVPAEEPKIVVPPPEEMLPAPDAPPQASPAPEPAEEQKDVPSTEYRVVILGDSEAGKSLICARLEDPQTDPKAYAGEVTPGINIISRDYRIGNRLVRVNFWDFGGQEILHSMHRMFLVEQTLYVIVLNTRNDNQDAQANYWMRYVQTYAPGAPVVLVMNKIDQNPGAVLNLPALKRQFSTVFNILDVLSISARDWSEQEFREGFTDKLLHHIGQVLNPACSFSPKERQVRNLLRQERRTRRIIDADQFRDLCEEAGLEDPKEQDELMIRFNRAGIVVFFGEKVQLLLDPEWITNAIYKILEKRRLFQTNGVIDEQDISNLYRRDPDKVYRTSHLQSVLPIMRAYGLSFQWEKEVPGNKETKDREFIPMLCRKEEPAQVDALLMKDELIEMQIRFEYLPIGVLHQLMVEYHDLLDRELVWLTGAVFHYQNGVSALVRKDGNVLHLYAWSHAMDISATQLQWLAKRVREISSDVRHRAAVQETLIGFNVAGITEFFDYDRLLNAKTSDIRYTASKIRPTPISVQDILDQTDRSEGRELRELLRLTLAGCKELQMNQTYWFWNPDASGHTAPKMDENARNRLLRFRLEQAFIVKDQTQGGESATGISSGELDLWIGTDQDTPLAILEALNITGDNADSRKRWTEHLHRMVKNYNKSGLRYLVLVSYLNCPEPDIDAVHGVYSGLLEGTRLDLYGGLPCAFKQELMPECPERIRITRADYPGGAGKVSVYHILVHIPRYLGGQ